MMGITEQQGKGGQVDSLVGRIQRLGRMGQEEVELYNSLLHV